MAANEDTAFRSDAESGADDSGGEYEVGDEEASDGTRGQQVRLAAP